MDKNTAQLMQALKEDILRYYPQTLFPKQLKGGLDAVLHCVDVKLSASLKEILNENIPANDSDDDDRPLISTKRAKTQITTSDDDEIMHVDKIDVDQVRKKLIIDDTATTSDRGLGRVRPWVEEQKKKLGCYTRSTPQQLQTIEEILKTEVKRLCPTVMFPTKRINIKEILDCIPENLYDAVLKGLCGVHDACNTEVAEVLLATPSKKEKANADMVTTGLRTVDDTEVTQLANISQSIQETPKRAVTDAGLFSKAATTVDTLDKQRIYQEKTIQTTVAVSPTTKTIRINRSPAVTYIRI